MRSIARIKAKIKRPCTTSHTGTRSLDCCSNSFYKSDPPVSTTSTMSSSTARISFPLSAPSKRNSAKLGDIIIRMSEQKLDLQGVISLLNRDNHRPLPEIKVRNYSASSVRSGKNVNTYSPSSGSTPSTHHSL